MKQFAILMNDALVEINLANSPKTKYYLEKKINRDCFRMKERETENEFLSHAYQIYAK